MVIWIHCSSNVTRRHNLLNFDRVNSPNYSILVTWKNMHAFLEYTANTAMQLSDSCSSEDLGCIAFWDPTWIEKVVLVHQHIYYMNNTKTWKACDFLKDDTILQILNNGRQALCLQETITRYDQPVAVKNVVVMGGFAISLEPTTGTGSYAINALEPKIHQWQASRQPSTPTKLTIFALQFVLTSIQQQLSAIEDKPSERMESEHSLPAGNMPMRPSAFITRRCINWMPQTALASCPDVSTRSTPSPTNICQPSNTKVIVLVSGPHWKLAHKGYRPVILTVQCARRAYSYTVEIQWPTLGHSLHKWFWGVGRSSKG